MTQDPGPPQKVNVGPMTFLNAKVGPCPPNLLPPSLKM